MFYEPKKGHGLPRDPIKACVVPRPIGWISTMSRTGVANLAPFSFSNLVTSSPPMFMFCCNGAHREGGVKDSALNAEETGEFVYNMATWDTREQMNATSASLARSSDEFEVAGLTKLESILVAPPRVAEAPISLECRTWKLVELLAASPEERNVMVIGEVIGVHIAGELLIDGIVDVTRARPIARLGYLDYSALEEVFQLRRPR
jgi:flavin reductase (DIM6/NTAB) family NADH-FMN oxidoreductase RutF